MKNHLFFMTIIGLLLTSCNPHATEPSTPTSSSGVKKATVAVQTDLNGNTIEQTNVMGRLKEDNIPGAIKHLYILSCYSGQCLIYSTVKGKVTSSGKRLTPLSIVTAGNTSNEGSRLTGFNVDINGSTRETSEVLQDDGTYGSSVEYIYWWDSKSVYHQQYITGGMMLHISSQPLAVKSIVLNFELQSDKN